MAEEDRPSLHVLPGGSGTGHTTPAVGEWPGPPWPHPEDPRLRIVLDAAREALRTGETDVDGALLYAAVHGWFEGALDVIEGQ